MSHHPIVVGTDGSPRANVAVDRAGELGEVLGATVHVVCAPTHLAGEDWPPRITAQQVVADAQTRLQERHISVETHLPTGDAAGAVAAVAEQVGARMIVMGNRGMTGIARLFGSLPNRVSHEARCDVLIVPTQARELPEYRARAVVAGTDGSQETARVLEEGIELAKALDGELHVVAIVDEPDAPEAALALQATEQGVRASAHALDGDPAKTLLRVAQDSDAAIIVIGSKGMLVGEREWFGNVADKLSHDGSHSVLLVGAAADGDAQPPASSPAGAELSAS